MAEIRWNSRHVTRAVLRWASRIAKGGEDRRQVLFKAELIPGGTIGPAKVRAWRGK
jgi:hypothetical protein